MSGEPNGDWKNTAAEWAREHIPPILIIPLLGLIVLGVILTKRERLSLSDALIAVVVIGIFVALMMLAWWWIERRSNGHLTNIQDGCLAGAQDGCVAGAEDGCVAGTEDDHLATICSAPVRDPIKRAFNLLQSGSAEDRYMAHIALTRAGSHVFPSAGLREYCLMRHIRDTGNDPIEFETLQERDYGIIFDLAERITTPEDEQDDFRLRTLIFQDMDLWNASNYWTWNEKYLPRRNHSNHSITWEFRRLFVLDDRWLVSLEDHDKKRLAGLIVGIYGHIHHGWDWLVYSAQQIQEGQRLSLLRRWPPPPEFQSAAAMCKHTAVFIERFRAGSSDEEIFLYHFYTRSGQPNGTVEKFVDTFDNLFHPQIADQQPRTREQVEKWLAERQADELAGRGLEPKLYSAALADAIRLADNYIEEFKKSVFLPK